MDTQKTYATVVEGMTCGNCALTISKVLEKKGATNISANAASGEVSFTIVENTNVDSIYDSIDDLGYHVVRQGDDNTTANQNVKYDYTTIYLLICALFTLPLLAHMFISWHVLHHPWVHFWLAAPVYGIGLWVFGRSAVRSLKHRLPNMDVLIILGASAAYIYSLIGLFFLS